MITNDALKQADFWPRDLMVPRSGKPGNRHLLLRMEASNAGVSGVESPVIKAIIFTAALIKANVEDNGSMDREFGNGTKTLPR